MIDEQEACSSAAESRTHYCGACQYRYAREAMHEVAGELCTVYYQDDPAHVKYTVQLVFITCPYHHTVGVKDGTITEVFPF